MTTHCPHCTWTVERTSRLRAVAALRVHVAHHHHAQPLPPRPSGTTGRPADTGQPTRSPAAGRVRHPSA